MAKVLIALTNNKAKPGLVEATSYDGRGAQQCLQTSVESIDSRHDHASPSRSSHRSNVLSSDPWDDRDESTSEAFTCYYRCFQADS
jgi:hypothetical protein